MPEKSWKELFSRSLEESGYSLEEVQRIFLLDMQATKFFHFDDLMPQSLELEDIERDAKEIRYYWSSNSG